jgi:hypothetical protein
MACRNEIVNTQILRICPDDPPVAADRVRAVFQARIVDEITEQPPDVDLNVRTTSTIVYPRATRGGLIGLVGQPFRVFPTLDVDVVDLDMRLTAPGYLPLELAGSLGPIPGFPDVFVPLDLGDVPLHRIPVELAGRTLRNNSLNPTIVAGASLSILGYWPTFPPANVNPPAVMLPPNLVNLSPGFYAPRESATGTLRARGFAPIAGEDKDLILPAGRGDQRLRLSNRTTLAPGSALIIDDLNAPIRERILVDQVDMNSDPDQPAWITLAHPLARTHLEGALVRVANLLPAGAVNSLVRAAIPGDETAFTDGLAGIAAGTIVEVEDAAGVPEYHEAALYESTSDADGYFRFPSLARAAMVLLHAERLGLISPDDARLSPDYRVAENRITVMFP